jgi:hypothetical protein
LITAADGWLEHWRGGAPQMVDYYKARQCLEYALQELDGDGDERTRLIRAWDRLRELGVGYVTVPAEIVDEVARMHADVAAWVLPRSSTALESTVAWMDEAQCSEAIERIARWRRIVDEAIARPSDD